VRRVGYQAGSDLADQLAAQGFRELLVVPLLFSVQN
jgi:hypothetical protein